MKLEVPPLSPMAKATIAEFLQDHCLWGDLRGAVVGLSGGIDSALVARLARDALGHHRVFGLLMPDDGPSAELVPEIEAYARSLGIAHRTIPIGPILDEFRARLPDVIDQMSWGNTKARIRMTLLYVLARERGALVLGTGNKSEILVGYFTKYGDGGTDVLPIGDLYKTQVRALAATLGLPEAIRARAPSAGLWPGQTDEDELGMPYTDLDPILYGLERSMPVGRIARAVGVPVAWVEAVRARVILNLHKRSPPPIAMVSEDERPRRSPGAGAARRR